MTKNPYLHDLVATPVLDAASAVALLHRLLAVATAYKKLPPRIEQARKRLAATLTRLQEALKTRLAAGTGSDSLRSRQADRAIDLAFSALYDFLTAYSKLPEGTPQRTSAQSLLSVLFGDGLKFTMLSFVKEWAEASARIQRIADDKLDAPIKALGGEVFLKNLAAAHKAYGEALGITSAKAATPSCQHRRRAAKRSQRGPAQVPATSHRAHLTTPTPATSELAEALLAPIADWQSPARKPSEEASAPKPYRRPQSRSGELKEPGRKLLAGAFSARPSAAAAALADARPCLDPKTAISV